LIVRQTLSFVGRDRMLDYLLQIAAIDEARARRNSITTLDTVPDTVLVLDESGNDSSDKHSC